MSNLEVEAELEGDFGDFQNNVTGNNTEESSLSRSCVGLGCAPFVAVEVILMFLTIIGNSLLISAFVRSKKLRKQSNYLLISLSVADLLTGLVVMPTFIINGYLVTSIPALNFLLKEKYFCLLKINLGTAMMLVSFVHQLVIAIERYIKICRPIQYLTLFAKKRLIIAIAVTWAYSIFVFLPPLLGWNNWTPEKECRANRVEKDFIQFIVIPHEPICILITLGLYAAIFRHVQEHKKKMKNHEVSHKKTEDRQKKILVLDEIPSVSGMTTVMTDVEGEPSSRGSQTADDAERPQGKGKNLQKSLRNGPSTQKSTKIKKTVSKMEVKVAKMTAVIVGTFILLFLPNIVAVITERYFEDPRIFGIVYNIAIEFIFVSSAINPLVYGILNKDIRKAMLRQKY